MARGGRHASLELISRRLGVCSESGINHRGERGEKRVFPSRPSSTLRTISMYTVFKLRHASDNSYLTSDTAEEK